MVLNDLMRIPGFAAYNGPFYGPILGLRFNGTHIGDLPPDLGLTREVEKTVAETIAVANVLIRKGIMDANLVKGERPDFVVETTEGPLLVEHTRVYPGCQEDSANHAMGEVRTLVTDPAIASAIGDLTVLISIDHCAVPVGPVEALTDPCPLEHVTKSEARKMVQEIRELALAGYFARVSGAERNTIGASEAKTLAKYRATCTVDVATSPEHVGISLSTFRFIPGKVSLQDAVDYEVGRKRKRVKKYPNAPDWLVVQVVQQADEFAYDLDKATHPEIGPFKNVFVLYWHDAQPYVAEWSVQPDGSVAVVVPTLHEIVQPYDAPLHDWSERVEDELDRYRVRAVRAGDGRRAKIFTSPMQVQWYRKWMGPNPWVMATSHGDAIRLQFWIAGDWDARETVDLDPSEVERAVSRIWNFLNPSEQMPEPLEITVTGT